MGIFQRKQQPQGKAPIDETSDGVQRFFDGYFAELKSRGRAHFEKSVEENKAAFKKDLDATITKAEAGLKEHIAQQLDEQIAENSKALKDAQDVAFQSLTQSAKTLQEQHQQLSQVLQKNVADQQAMLANTFEENKAQIVAMKETQAQAVQWLQQSAQAMQEQHQQLIQAMQKSVADQESALIAAFEENMAQVVEHYLLGALGDQYDLKSQLPSIIKQMEASKQDMMDDMKL